MTQPALGSAIERGSPGSDLLVLGPSLGTTTALWDLAMPALTERFRVIRYDLPGHGRSRGTSEKFSIADLADAVVAVVDSIGGGEFHYAGISMGGAIGIDLALRYPRRVRSLAVICSAAKIGTADGWHDRATLARRDGTASLVAISAERWFAPGFLDLAPGVGASALAALRDVDDESYSLCCEALAGFDARGRDIRIPLLAIAGELDVAVPLDAMRDLGGRLEVIDGVGHLPSLEAPAELVALILDHALPGVPNQ